MKLLASLCLSAIAFGAAAPAAKADPVQFQLTNVVATNGAVLTGIITIDTATGIGETGPSGVTLTKGGQSATFSGNTTVTTNNLPGHIDVDYQTPGFSIGLLLPGPTLVGYTGGNICSTTNPCSGAASQYFYPSGGPTLGGGSQIASGSLTAVTPEPSSIALLSTGLLALAWQRKRIATAR